MNDFVKLAARPKLNSPNMIAAWPGIGHVSMLVANYLEKKLDFKKLGEIKASHFFDCRVFMSIHFKLITQLVGHTLAQTSLGN